MQVHNLLAAATVLALPLVAFAADGAAKPGLIPTFDQGFVSAITALVVFAVVLAVLSLLVWPKISSGLADRENKIRESIEAAESAQAQAKAQLEQYNKALADARAEAQRMLESARQQQMASAAEMKTKAEVELSQMKAKAVADIEAAKKQAISDVYSASVSLATQIAGKVLQREVNGADASRFAQEAIAQLGSNN